MISVLLTTVAISPDSPLSRPRHYVPASRSTISAYRRLATTAARYAYVPYSHRHEAALLVFGDGSWIPGVRVESAAFSLTIPPLLNAATTAAALGAGPIRAVIVSRALSPQEILFAEGMHLLEGLSRTAPDVLGAVSDVPEPVERRSPFVAPDDVTIHAVPGRRSSDAAAYSVDPEAAMVIARRLARRAHVPESDFPVGCILEIDGQRFVPGVNVEHADWTHILCAERNALGTAVSYGFDRIAGIYLTCLNDSGCTPCGACRQLIAELAPASALWMDRGAGPPASSTPITLLPGAFAGNRLSRDT